MATPSWTTAGKVTPTGTPRPISKDSTKAVTVSATASGVEGWGVGIRRRSADSAPVLRSTGAPLMPLPPISTPKAFLIMTVLVLVSRVAGRPAGRRGQCAKDRPSGPARPDPHGRSSCARQQFRSAGGDHQEIGRASCRERGEIRGGGGGGEA